MKKTISIMLAGILTVSLLAGCGQKADQSAASTTPENSVQASTVQEATQPAEPELTGTVHWVTNRVDLATTTHKQLADEFTALHPGVKIEIEGIKDTEQVLRTRFAANEVNDVTFVPGWIPKTDWSKYFAPLDDLGYNSDNLFFYDAYKADDGKHYAVQTMISYNAMFYMKSAFQKAGITSTPKTEEEFLADCEKLKQAGITPLAINFKDKWPMLWYYRYYPVVTTGDVSYVYNLKNTDTLLDPSGPLVHMLNLLDGMNQKGYLEKDLMSTNYDNIFRKDMAQGKIAMAFLGTWFPDQLVQYGANPDDIGAFPFPGSKILQGAGDWAFGVAANSKALDASKAFLKYITDDGRYTTAGGGISPLKNVTPTQGFVEELLSSGLPVVEDPGTPDDYSAVLAKSKTNELQEMMQEYLLAKGDKAKQDALIAKTNQQWADGRKEAGMK